MGMSIDAWMNKQLNDYLDADCRPEDGFKFNFKTRLNGSGVVKVYCEANYEKNGDEDGEYTEYVAHIINAHWAFSEDFEVDIEDIKDELQFIVQEKLDEEIRNF